jgi:hypothetical protein
MTINGASRTVQTRQVRRGMELALGSVARPNPLVIAWRWRYELDGALGLAVAVYALTSAVGPWWALAVIAAAAGSLAAWPTARRQTVVRAWCIITPHRVRTGCAQAWIHSRQGKIPTVLLTTAQPFGERVYLWLRAGVGAEDLIAVRPLLAAACWADDVKIARNDRYAHLVVLDVIRRSFARPAGGDLLEIEQPPRWPQAGIARRKLVESPYQRGVPAGRGRDHAGIQRSADSQAPGAGVAVGINLSLFQNANFSHCGSTLLAVPPMLPGLRVPGSNHAKLSRRCGRAIVSTARRRPRVRGRPPSR